MFWWKWDDGYSVASGLWERWGMKRLGVFAYSEFVLSTYEKGLPRKAFFFFDVVPS
jgi:hypothetical protein